MKANRRGNVSALRVREFACALAAGLVLPAGFAMRVAAQEKSKPPSVFKTTTSVVNVYAVVEQGKGRLIPNLTREDFEITDDGRPQTIKYFSRATDTPLTLAILVDTSPSQERVLPTEQQEADAFVRQVIRPKDEACVIHFDLEVELLQDFTSDVARLTHAIDETTINGGAQSPTPSTFPTGQQACCTDLYDAVYLASHDVLRNEVGRKVIILLTDGQDEGSKETLDGALEAAQKADVIIYSINVSDRAFYGLGGFSFEGDSVLKKLSDETGGRVLDVRRAKQMSQAFQQIADELRTQYQLGYTPDPPPTEPSFHRIRVQVRSGHYKVLARRGYYWRPH